MTYSMETASLEEVRKRYPIIISDPDPKWSTRYREESIRIMNFLKPHIPVHAIHHIGSTAIGGIKAKPIVDILVEIEVTAWPHVQKLFIDQGYSCLQDIYYKMTYAKGYEETGFGDEVYHIHIKNIGDTEELDFRDYLIAHPEVAKTYEAMKVNLARIYRNQRDLYTDAKGTFVRAVLNRVKEDKWLMNCK